MSSALSQIYLLSFPIHLTPLAAKHFFNNEKIKDLFYFYFILLELYFTTLCHKRKTVIKSSKKKKKKKKFSRLYSFKHEVGRGKI